MRLFHISFNGNLQGVWKPRSPYSQMSDKEQVVLKHDDFLAEPDEPRISVSPTIEKCFQAIYANIKHYFLDKKYPYMDMYVYMPELTKSSKVVTPQELTKQRKVWDAFYTEEHWITTPTKMKVVAKIRVANTSDSGCIEIYPFNDKKYAHKTDKSYICPREVSFKVIDLYDKQISLESVGDKITYLYHYSHKKLNKLETLRLQGVLSKEDMVKMDEYAKKTHFPYSYYDHVSFFIDRPPLDIIHTLFPKDHPAWSKGKVLYEYVVPVSSIQVKYWELVESKLHQALINFYAPDNEKLIDVWWRVSNTLAKVVGNQGKNTTDLIRTVNRNKDKTRYNYINQGKRDSYQYASNVPHLMVYIDEPIVVNTPNKVVVGEKMKSLSLEHKAENGKQGGVCAFITNPENSGELFTLYHYWRNHYTFPSGTIDAGETPDETLIREMKEELGVHVNDFKLINVISHKGMERDGSIIDFKTHIFHVSGYSGVISNLEPESHDQLGFRNLEHEMFVNPDNPISEYAIKWLKSYNKLNNLDLLSAFKEMFSQEATKAYTPKESSRFPGWYEAPGYPYFLANEKGELCNSKTGRVLSGSKNDRGYIVVAEWDNDDKKKKDYKSHRIICTAFHGPCPGSSYEVGHKNDVRDDNKPSNLHWTTRSDNMARVHR